MSSATAAITADGLTAAPDQARDRDLVYDHTLPTSEFRRLRSKINETLSARAQSRRVTPQTTSMLDSFPDTKAFKIPSSTLNNSFSPKKMATRVSGKTIPIRFDILEERVSRDERKVTLSDFRLDTTHSSGASISIGKIELQDTKGHKAPLWPDTGKLSWTNFGVDDASGGAAAAAREYTRYVLAGYSAATLRLRVADIVVNTERELKVDDDSLRAFADENQRRQSVRKSITASRDGDGFLSERSIPLGKATVYLVFGGDRGSDKVEYRAEDTPLRLRLQSRPREKDRWGGILNWFSSRSSRG